jgi:hypothetical protein
MHLFILQTFQVSVDCHTKKDCYKAQTTPIKNENLTEIDSTSSNKNIYPVPSNFYSWEVLTDLQYLKIGPSKNIVDYKGLVAKYM